MTSPVTRVITTIKYIFAFLKSFFIPAPKFFIFAGNFP